MSKTPDYGGLSFYTLTDRSLYRLIEQQDDGFRELPDEREFALLENTPKRKKRLRIAQQLRSLMKKRKYRMYRPTIAQ